MCKDEGIGVEFAVRLQPCVNGGCTENGECREYFSGVFHFSSCYCIAGASGGVFSYFLFRSGWDGVVHLQTGDNGCCLFTGL